MGLACQHRFVVTCTGLLCSLLAPVVSAPALDYTCASPCEPPGCICPSTNGPGGLAVEDTPQMVLISFDDAVYQAPYDLYQPVLTNHWNPNGKPIQATFFATTKWTNYRLLQQLYAQGHEIAVHTMTHTTSSNTDLATWRREILGCRKAFSDLCGIPLDELVGFRAPHLQFNNGSFQTLFDAGMMYDASVPEAPGNLSPNAAYEIWPYTLDTGLAQPATTGTDPAAPFPGIFEVPLWKLLDTNEAYVATMDPPGTHTQVVDLLKLNFLKHYTGNRAPFTIGLHAYWFTNGVWCTDALNEFIDWAQAYPDVWFVTTRAAVEFMKQPCAASNAHLFAAFNPPERSICDDLDVVTCVYSTDTFQTCAECPDAYPQPDTVFRKAEAVSGGVMALRVTTNYSSSYEVQILISNDTDCVITDWQAVFTLATGEVTAIWRGVLTNEGTFQIVRPTATTTPLAPGETHSVGFEVRYYNGVTNFWGDTLTLYELEAVRPGMNITINSNRTGLTLDWDNASVGMRLDFTTNEDMSGWAAVTTLYGRVAWTSTIPVDTFTGYYRIKTQEQ